MFGKKERIMQTQAKNMERYRAELEDMRQKNAVLQDLVDAMKKDNKRLTRQAQILTENLDKTEAAFRSATNEIERLRDEIQRRNRLYQAGTDKMHAKMGEMGRIIHQLQYQNTVLKINKDSTAETLAQYERDFMAATADNRELQARLLCYQGVEKLLFTAAAESAPAAEQEDSGKEACGGFTAGQVVFYGDDRVRIVDIDKETGTAFVYYEDDGTFDTVPTVGLHVQVRDFMAVDFADRYRIIQYSDGYLIVVLQKTDSGEWKVMHTHNEVYMLTENGLHRLGQEIIKDLGEAEEE